MVEVMDGEDRLFADPEVVTAVFNRLVLPE